jgi:hypothetical protein
MTEFSLNAVSFAGLVNRNGAEATEAKHYWKKSKYMFYCVGYCRSFINIQLTVQYGMTDKLERMCKDVVVA